MPESAAPPSSVARCYRGDRHLVLLDQLLRDLRCFEHDLERVALGRGSEDVVASSATASSEESRSTFVPFRGRGRVAVRRAAEGRDGVMPPGYSAYPATKEPPIRWAAPLSWRVR